MSRLPDRITRVVVAGIALAALAPAAASAGPPAQQGGRPPWFPTATHAAAIASSGLPRDARMSVPSIGLRGVRVIAYRGATDDAPGTFIQNRTLAASPYGPRGGVGPGGIGNYQVTGHRASHGELFRHTPALRRGARILIDVGRWRYLYRVVRTRWVDFRSADSLAQQRAAVPGHPGAVAHQAWLTLSTCATPEDHARGDYWADRFGNPRHRIDKIAVLVRRLPRG